MKIAYPTWMTKCDPAEIKEAYEEATVDCYGDEQASGLVDMAIQELAVHFPAIVLGQRVEVVGASPARNAAWGVDLIVETGKKQFAISASSVELREPFPVGHLYLAALLVWHSKM
ncbi:hypothetical protein [Allorhodopirellula heiligendammensis]|uniref:Uncharacterized protein n=1 Tax=Allorhodopirellula heiligendammensis TaxID=2714739 RepID=A0A5C6C7X9_9BACT|nr:hypothetical protein [Allorhodopirellula heiligendammensis]TWU18859.1 hypothetical protein Poly21_10260 [Allorhodopirellula heiligendammensis]